MPNPFVYDRPLPPDQLVDRESELELLASLADGGQSARLTGPRRYGKTTLLGRLAQLMRNDQRFAVALVDMSRAATVADVAQRIGAAYDEAFTGPVQRVWRSLRRHIVPQASIGVPGVANVALAPTHSGSDPLGTLHELLETPKRLHDRTGCRCLVVYDEFQEMLAAQADLDGVLRSHIQHHAGAVSYLFAGSHTGMMDALFGDRSRPLFEQARAVQVGPLPQAGLADFLESRYANAGRSLSDGVSERLAGIVAGHPQRAMMVSHFLWEQAGEKLDLDDLDAAWHSAIGEASDGLQRTWDSLSPGQRKLVKAVAAGYDKPLRKVALEWAGLAKSSAADARDALVAQGDMFSHGDGRVSLSDPFLAAWGLS